MNAPGKSSHRDLVPVTAAVVIAVVGVASLYLMDFGPKNTVPHPGINMITAATVARAGATALPTEPDLKKTTSASRSR